MKHNKRLHQVLFLRRKSLSGGFTLAEAIAALVVVALGVTGSISAITHSLHDTNQNELATWVHAALDRQIEQLSNRTFNTLPASGAFIDSDGDGIGDGLEHIPPHVRNDPNFQSQISICQYNPVTGGCGGGDPDIRLATATISLDAARTWRLTTVISQP